MQMAGYAVHSIGKVYQICGVVSENPRSELPLRTALQPHPFKG